MYHSVTRAVIGVLLLGFSCCQSWAATPLVYTHPAHQSPLRGDPDDLLLIPGFGLAADNIVVYQAVSDTTHLPTHPTSIPTTSNATLGVADLVSSADAPYSLAVHLPAGMTANQSYALWVHAADGTWSAPIPINDARPLWITPDSAYSTAAFAGLPRVLKVVGRNLQPGPGTATATQVRLVGGCGHGDDLHLRARHRCPVCLLVVTIEEAVARWAARCIDLGPGTRCQPSVVGPSNTPVITELQDAQENVELAVLSAIGHGQSPDIALAARIASAAILASADIDVERSRLYLDLILISLSQNAPEAFEATMNSLGYEYQSDFARRYYGQGRAEGKEEGKAEGRIELILKLLTLRFGPLTEAARARVRGAQDAQLDGVAERMLTAKSLEEALSQLTELSQTQIQALVSPGL